MAAPGRDAVVNAVRRLRTPENAVHLRPPDDRIHMSSLSRRDGRCYPRLEVCTDDVPHRIWSVCSPDCATAAPSVMNRLPITCPREWCPCVLLIATRCRGCGGGALRGVRRLRAPHDRVHVDPSGWRRVAGGARHVPATLLYVRRPWNTGTGRKEWPTTLRVFAIYSPAAAPRRSNSLAA